MTRFEVERRSQGFTLMGLAKELLVDVSTVHAWESGRNKMSPKSFKKLLDLGFDKKALINPTEEVE